jgi:hypothetical protein
MVFSVLLAGVVIAWLVVLGLGVTIAVDGFRDSIEAAASRALGVEVHVNGALVFRPTVGPTIVAHDVRVASPAGGEDLLRAGRIKLRLAPVALLRGEPRSRRLLIEDASIDLDGGWAVAHGAGPVQADEAKAGVVAQLLPAAAEMLAGQPELRKLVLRRVVLNDRIELDAVSVRTRPGQPLELTIRGLFQQQPYTIELSGGRLADLLKSSRPWPLRMQMSLADTRLLLSGDLEATRQGLELTFVLEPGGSGELAGLVARLVAVPLAGRLLLRAEQAPGGIGAELQLPAFDAVLRFGAGAGGAGYTADRPNSIPLTVSVADVPFHGQLMMAGHGSELALSATDADAGGLLAMFTGATGIRVRVRHIGLQAAVHGGSATDLVKRLGLALQLDDARLSYGNAGDERPRDVTLDELTLNLPAGESLLLRAQGELLDESFSVGFTAGGLEALLLEDSWPITLSASGGGAELDISGALATAGTNTATQLQVDLYGKRLGDLAAWLGVSPCAAASYTLRAQLVLAEDIGRLQFLQLQTDGTRLNGELDWSGYDQLDLMHAVLHFEKLDTADIEALMSLVNQDRESGSARGISIDMPVLPRRIEINNADIDLTIEHILLKLMDIAEVSLSARIRDGGLQRSPFRAQFGSAGFQGYLEPTSAGVTLVFENERDGAGGRLDKLFSSAVRWVGNTAVVPLRWIVGKTFSAAEETECQAQGATAAH